jgi:hypothetical protein
MLPKSGLTVIDSGLHCRMVFPGRNNSYYVTTYSNDLVKVTPGFQKQKIPFSGDILKIKTILEDSDGFLWIAANDEGVYCLKNNKVFSRFSINEAHGLLQDHEQNIWVSTQTDGIYIINHDILEQQHFNRTNFENQGVNKVRDFPGMGIWCSNTKAVFLLKNGVFYKLPVPKDIQPVEILYLFKNHTLMLGSISQQVC